MSSFFISFRNAVGNLGLQFLNTTYNPKGIYTHYSRRSIALTGTFLISNIVEYIINRINESYKYNENDFLKKKKKKKNNDNELSRGNQFFQFFYILAVSTWDTVYECHLQGSLPDFFTVIEQGILTIFTIFIIMYLITLFPYYITIGETLPFFVTNVIEGGILFVIYNWVVNLRNRFKYNSCTQLNILEIEQNALINTQDKVGFLYKNRPSTLYVTKKGYINDAEYDSGSSVYKSKDLDYVKLT